MTIHNYKDKISKFATEFECSKRKANKLIIGLLNLGWARINHWDKANLHLTTWTKIEEYFGIDTSKRKYERKAKCLPVDFTNKPTNITPLEYLESIIIELQANRKHYAIFHNFIETTTKEEKGLSKRELTIRNSSSTFEERYINYMASFEHHILLSCTEIAKTFKITKMAAWKKVNKLKQLGLLTISPVFAIKDYSEKLYCKKVNGHLLEQQANYIEFTNPTVCNRFVKYSKDLLKKAIVINNSKVDELVSKVPVKYIPKKLKPEYSKCRYIFYIDESGEIVAREEMIINKVHIKDQYKRKAGSKTFTNSHGIEAYSIVDNNCKRVIYDIENGYEKKVSEKQVTIGMLKRLEQLTNNVIVVGKNKYISNRAYVLNDNIKESKKLFISSLSSWNYSSGINTDNINFV